MSRFLDCGFGKVVPPCRRLPPSRRHHRRSSTGPPWRLNVLSRRVLVEDFADRATDPRRRVPNEEGHGLLGSRPPMPHFRLRDPRVRERLLDGAPSALEGPELRLFDAGASEVERVLALLDRLADRRPEQEVICVELRKAP